MRSCDDTAKAQEDRMNAVTTNLSHAVVYIDKKLSMWSRKRLASVREYACGTGSSEQLRPAAQRECHPQTRFEGAVRGRKTRAKRVCPWHPRDVAEVTVLRMIALRPTSGPKPDLHERAGIAVWRRHPTAFRCLRASFRTDYLANFSHPNCDESLAPQTPGVHSSQPRKPSPSLSFTVRDQVTRPKRAGLLIPRAGQGTAAS